MCVCVCVFYLNKKHFTEIWAKQTPKSLFEKYETNSELEAMGDGSRAAWLRKEKDIPAFEKLIVEGLFWWSRG